MNLAPCPCCSGKKYLECCQPFHQGVLPSNALALMRSRYSAYALKNTAYIIFTTHPLNPHYKQDHLEWTKEIDHYCLNTSFEKLEIVDFEDGLSEAFVTFIAFLTQAKKKIRMQEKSRFEKSTGRWLYHSQSILKII